MTPGRRWLDVLVTLVVLAALAVVAGVVWWWVWTPPTGVVVDQRWVLDAQGLAREFDATAWYVVIAAVAGLLGGLVVSWQARGGELLTLGALAVGSVLAGWLMHQVGHALGPPDPQTLAQGRADMTPLPGSLRVGGEGAGPAWAGPGASAFVAFPAGAVSAAAAVFLMTDRPRRRSRSGSLR
jgi:uncharacterized membrane protein YeaQ/YmgE (transglycosylase-associated protein family)